MNWKIGVIITFILLASILSYELTKKDTYIEVQELSSFDSIKPNTLKRITNQKDVRQIKKEFRKSKRIPGIVDMTAPDYLVKINKKEYYLWLDPVSKGAAMMKKSNTNAAYKLSEEKVFKIISVLYTTEQ